MPTNRIAAVVVSYQPDLPKLRALLQALRQQVRWLILVDNCSRSDFSDLIGAGDGGLELITLDENLGLAAAQNIGISRALAHGAEFVFLSDQDSLPSPGMVALLEAAHQHAASEPHSPPVAATGPVAVDSRTGVPSFFVIERHGWPRRYHPGAARENTVEAGFLIASGCMLSSAAIRAIGGMRSAYFIDHVDTEWCRRARAAGYRLLGVPGARMQHHLGDSVARVWFFGWRQVMAHSPLRDYYVFRNTLLMLRDAPMGAWWRLHFVWRLLQFAGYFLASGDQRRLRCRLMLRGLWDGWSGREGRFNPATAACTTIPTTSLDPGSTGPT